MACQLIQVGEHGWIKMRSCERLITKAKEDGIEMLISSAVDKKIETALLREIEHTNVRGKATGDIFKECSMDGNQT